MKGMFCDSCGTLVDVDRDPESIHDTSGHNMGPWEVFCWDCRDPFTQEYECDRMEYEKNVAN